MSEPTTEHGTPIHQAGTLVKGSSNILLLTHANPDGDGIGASLALSLALQKLGKRTTFFAAGKIPDTFRFLPRLDLLTQKLPGGRDFIISINTTQTQVEKVQFQQVDGHLDLIVTPKGGTFDAADVTTRIREQSYDLIITSDMGELKLVGSLLDERRELFQHTPILNIDHHATNEQFGHVNLVDAAAASSTELVYRLLEEIAPGHALIDGDIATCLLNGLITDTGSFQHANTTPRAFSLAATLLAAGARQQEIIRHVFKTKEFSTLKLWGTALSKLTVEPDIGLVWTALTREDFEQFHAESDASNGLIDELLSSAPEASFVMLLREDPDGLLKGSLRAVRPDADVAVLSGLFGGGGHTKAAGFKIPHATVASDATRIVDAFRGFLRENGRAVERPAEHQAPDPMILPEVARTPLGQG